MSCKTFCIICATIISLCSYGQRRSMDEAKQILINRNAAYNKCKTFTAFQKQIVACKNTSQVAYAPFYVFSDTISERFVIISGDERMQTILAECNKTHFDDNNIPPALQELMSLYEERYDSLHSGTSEESKLYASTLQAPDISPLMDLKWGQDSPFNDMCPQRSASGCVATAMSQIMKYYDYPAVGRGTYSYTSDTKWYSCSFDFSAAHFDWDNMLSYYGLGSSERNNRAVSELLYACGVSVSMDYDTESGAYAVDVPFALINYFGYNPYISCLNRAYYSTSDWLSILYKELESGRPVLYTGSDSRSGGHAFVVHGCRSSDGNVYVNWGWNGRYDGYYALDALDPDRYRFSSNQSMVYNIYPESMGEEETIFYADKMYLSKDMSMNAKAEFNLIDLWCSVNKATYGCKKNKFQGIIGLMLCDEDGVELRILTEKNTDELRAFEGYDKIILPFVPSQEFLIDGRYIIRPYARPTNSDKKTFIRTEGGKTDSYSFYVENGLINGVGSVNPDIGDKTVVWQEDFEKTALGNTVSNNLIIGDGVWETIKVMMSSSNIPDAYSGKGYAYIKYKNNTFNETINVCQLQTEKIYLGIDKNYSLCFASLKHTSNKQSEDMLTILYSTDGKEWESLQSINVQNTTEWSDKYLPLPNVTSLYLAFEGSIHSGSSLYIDNIRVVEDTTLKITKKNALSDGQKNFYGLMGEKYHSIVSPGIYIVNGKKTIIH